ncbi:MAG: BamA/TamA family outer membrane protein [Planctomycetota bacterium]
MTTRSGRPLLDYGLKRDAEMIANLHRKEGFHFVNVQPLKRPTGRQDVEDVVFVVHTGPRPKVFNVLFEGAHSVKRRQLQRLVQNSDRYRTQFLGLGRLFNPTYFNADLLEEDRRRLEFWYRQEGWQDARVVLVGYRFENDNKEAFIHFRIDEGQRYRIRGFTVEYEEDGDPLPKDREFLSVDNLERLAVFAPGYAFRAEDIEQTRLRIQERLWSRAYAKSGVRQDYDINPLDRSIQITFRIDAGPKIRLGRIRILGNRFTRDNVIRRAYRGEALPGEELNVSALRAGQTRLRALNFFGLVRYGTGRPGSIFGLVKSNNEDREDEYDVELEVEEIDTRSIQFGAGVSTDGGIFGFVQVTWRNFDIFRLPQKWWRVLDKDAFRGGGQTFSIEFAPGTVFSRFRIAFSDPRLNDSQWGFNIEISRRLAQFTDYDQSTDGIYLGFSRFLDRKFNWRLTLNWSLREVTLDDPDPTAPVNMLDEQGRSTVHGVGARLNYTRVRGGDPFLNGYRLTFTTDWYGGPLGGEVDVVKATIRGALGSRAYRNRQGSWQRFRVEARVDWATAYDDTVQVPIFERYFLGGRNLRGFEFRGVGPKSNGSPSGGEFLVSVIGQYTFPIADRDVTGFGIDIHFFLDQGTLVEDTQDISWETWRISAGFGFGIQFGSPNQPPLTIDFAWPIRRVNTDTRQVVSVSFERTF